MSQSTPNRHPTALGLAVWAIVSADRDTKSGPNAAAISVNGTSVQLKDLPTTAPPAYPDLSPDDVVSFNALLDPSLLWVSVPATQGGPVQFYPYLSYNSTSPTVLTCGVVGADLTLAVPSNTAPQNQLWITRGTSGSPENVLMIETVATSGSGGGGSIKRQTQYPIALSPMVLGASAPLPNLNPYRYEFIQISPGKGIGMTLAAADPGKAQANKLPDAGKGKKASG